MVRRGSSKTAEVGRGATDPRETREVPPNAARKIPLHPRRGHRLLLSASAALFLCWLALLAWLAFS
jgi:hypothetical protein